MVLASDRCICPRRQWLFMRSCPSAPPTSLGIVLTSMVPLTARGSARCAVSMYTLCVRILAALLSWNTGGATSNTSPCCAPRSGLRRRVSWAPCVLMFSGRTCTLLSRTVRQHLLLLLRHSLLVGVMPLARV